MATALKPVAPNQKGQSKGQRNSPGFQAWMGEVHAYNKAHDKPTLNHRPPDPDAPRFSQKRDDQRQLDQLGKADDKRYGTSPDRPQPRPRKGTDPGITYGPPSPLWKEERPAAPEKHSSVWGFHEPTLSAAEGAGAAGGRVLDALGDDKNAWMGTGLAAGAAGGVNRGFKYAHSGLSDRLRELQGWGAEALRRYKLLGGTAETLNKTLKNRAMDLKNREVIVQGFRDATDIAAPPQTLGWHQLGSMNIAGNRLEAVTAHPGPVGQWRASELWDRDELIRFKEAGDSVIESGARGNAAYGAVSRQVGRMLDNPGFNFKRPAKYGPEPLGPGDPLHYKGEHGQHYERDWRNDPVSGHYGEPPDRPTNFLNESESSALRRLTQFEQMDPAEQRRVANLNDAEFALERQAHQRRQATQARVDFNNMTPDERRALEAADTAQAEHDHLHIDTTNPYLRDTPRDEFGISNRMRLSPGNEWAAPPRARGSLWTPEERASRLRGDALDTRAQDLGMNEPPYFTPEEQARSLSLRRDLNQLGFDDISVNDSARVEAWRFEHGPVGPPFTAEEIARLNPPVPSVRRNLWNDERGSWNPFARPLPPKNFDAGGFNPSLRTLVGKDPSMREHTYKDYLGGRQIDKEVGEGMLNLDPESLSRMSQLNVREQRAVEGSIKGEGALKRQTKQNMDPGSGGGEPSDATLARFGFVRGYKSK